MTSVKVNEIPLIDDENISADDSLLVLDAPTRATLRLNLQQLAVYIEDVLIERALITAAKGPFGSIQFNKNGSVSGSSGLIFEDATNTIKGINAEFVNITASILSASSYINLPEVDRIIVSSSISLQATQRAVFASNYLSPTVTITLPNAASAESREYHFVKADNLGGKIVLSGSGSQLVNGKDAFELHGPYQAVTLFSDGTGWYIF